LSENPDNGRQGRQERRGERGGFTLAEITVAVAVFAVMAGGVVFSLTRAKYLSWANRERLLALEAAHSKME
jgi:prepilin-type N-terminal cleavage/methylation domain-containing protein